MKSWQGLLVDTTACFGAAHLKQGLSPHDFLHLHNHSHDRNSSRVTIRRLRNRWVVPVALQ